MQVKRLFSLLLLCALLSALAAPALADVAYLPRDNFIEKHWDECSYENRWYWTNGAEGYVLAHKTPGSAEAAPLPNGGKYYVSNVYRDEWGVLEYDPDTLENALGNGSVSGWVKMSDMAADYDADAFYADHRSELVTDGDAELEIDSGRTVYLYKYPGSGEVTGELSGSWGGDPISFNTRFTDPAGRQWGYCNYYYGHRDFWVCLDDPFNDALAPDENSVTIVTAPAAAPVPTAAPTPEPPSPTAAPTVAPSPEPGGAPAPTAAPTVAPNSTEAPRPTQSTVPSETPAPTTAPGKTVELTPPADKETLDQAAKDNRGAGPYIAAGAAAVVIIAAAVLAATLKKKKK